MFASGKIRNTSLNSIDMIHKYYKTYHFLQMQIPNVFFTSEIVLFSNKQLSCWGSTQLSIVHNPVCSTR